MRSADPQPDGFAAGIVQCAGVAERSELAGPLGIAGDDEPDAARACLLEDLGGVYTAEFLGEREAPVVLYPAGGLSVVQDLAGAELADQPGDAQVAGLDGTAQLDAGQPVASSTSACGVLMTPARRVRTASSGPPKG